jgi:hypothetical protein
MSAVENNNNSDSNSESESTPEVDFSRPAYFTVKGDSTKLILVRKPFKLMASAWKSGFSDIIENQLTRDFDDEKYRYVKIVEKSSVGGKKRKTRSTPATETDGESKPKTRKTVSCKWCRENGHEDTALGHNSRGCQKKKAATAVDVPVSPSPQGESSPEPVKNTEIDVPVSPASQGDSSPEPVKNMAVEPVVPESMGVVALEAVTASAQ